MQQRPANLPLSLALAGRGFVMGVCLGLSGVVLDPIRGKNYFVYPQNELLSVQHLLEIFFKPSKSSII
jgi:hypothetical protein